MRLPSRPWVAVFVLAASVVAAMLPFSFYIASLIRAKHNVEELNQLQRQMNTCALAAMKLEAALFAWALPHISGILIPEFTWYGMNVLAVIVLAVVFTAGRSLISSHLS